MEKMKQEFDEKVKKMEITAEERKKREEEMVRGMQEQLNSCNSEGTRQS